MALMAIRSDNWPAGVPCWADVTVPDVAAASAFYRAVIGWDIAEPDEEYGGYVIAQVDGKAAAGIGPQQQPGPAAWTLYLASDDADKSAAAVTEHGGTVLFPPGDVGPLGRMFIAADPTGAAFGVWQAGTHIGASVVNEPGGITWEDLRSPDPDTARTFYNAVFGYDFTPLDGAGPAYQTFALAGEEAPLGGMGDLMGTDLPPHWVVYFAVADISAATAAVAGNGGTVVQEPFDTPYGRMAAVTDPAGAAFMLAQLPDPS
jgi:uncharacterized protein